MAAVFSLGRELVLSIYNNGSFDYFMKGSPGKINANKPFFLFACD